MIFGMAASTFTLVHVMVSLAGSSQDSSSSSDCSLGNGSTAGLRSFLTSTVVTSVTGFRLSV